MPDELRSKLITQAAQATLVLGHQLNLLLDAHDFFMNRYPAQNKTDDLHLKDLRVSVNELGIIPHQVATTLLHWKRDEEPTLSRLGFEINVLNEMSIHMFAVHRFMMQRSIDIDAYFPTLVGQAFQSLRNANRLLTKNTTRS